MTDIMKLADDYASAQGDARADLGANAGMDDQDLMWIAMKEARAALQSAIEALQTECAEHKENAIRNARIAVSIRAERDQLQAENERLKDDLDDAIRGPWAEWAEKITKSVRKRSGYDGFDDQAEGVDLPTEVEDCLCELEHLIKKIASERDALKSKLDAMGKGEPIYQYQMGDGSWIDQTKHSYDYNRNHAPNAVVRIVYAAPKALAPEPLTDERKYKLLDHGDEIQRGDTVLDDDATTWHPLAGWEVGMKWGCGLMPMRRAIEAAHGIGGTP